LNCPGKHNPDASGDFAANRPISANMDKIMTSAEREYQTRRAALHFSGPKKIYKKIS